MCRPLFWSSSGRCITKVILQEKEKSEAIPVQSWIGTEVSRRLRLPDLKTITTWRSALRTGCLYSQVNMPGTHFCQGLSRPQGHNPAGKVKSIKNLTGPIGNRNCDLPASSAVAKPPAPPRAPLGRYKHSCMSLYWERMFIWLSSFLR